MIIVLTLHSGCAREHRLRRPHVQSQDRRGARRRVPQAGPLGAQMGPHLHRRGQARQPHLCTGG